MRSWLRLATLLAALLSIGTAVQGPFSATLSTPLEQEMGEDVTCQVEITNNDDVTYYLLKRRTPLEGIKAHIFSIKKGKDLDSTVKYDGFFFKRGPAMDEEYMRIPGRSSVSATVVLSKAYSFDTPSVYSVKLNTTLRYSKSLRGAPSSQHLSSNTAHLTLLSTGRHPKLTEPEILRREDQQKLRDVPHSMLSRETPYIKPAFDGNWPRSDRKSTRKAFGRAYKKAIASKAEVDNNPDTYTTWFGTPNDERKGIVKDVYEIIKSDMETYKHILESYGEHCAPSIYAYTWYLSVRIVLCHLYFPAPDTGYDSKFGILIHELSHSSADTDDVEGAYGTSGAQDLASRDPSLAVDNADCYEFFSESI